MDHGEVPLCLVCKPLYTGNRSEASRSYSVQKPQLSNPKTTKNSHKNFPLPLHCTLHIMCHKSPSNCLSRLEGQKDTIKLPKLHLYQITNQLCVRSDNLNKLRVSMQADDELNLLKHTIMYAESINQVPHIYSHTGLSEKNLL